MIGGFEFFNFVVRQSPVMTSQICGETERLDLAIVLKWMEPVAVVLAIVSGRKTGFSYCFNLYQVCSLSCW
jgi:uncharacterized membrane protein